VLPAFGAVLLAGLLALHRPLFSLLVQEDSVIDVRNANLQAELTVHNLSAVHTLYLIGQLAVGLYGSLGPWLMYRHRSAAIRLNTRLFVPPLFLSGFLLHALYRIGREGPLPAINFGEWFELCVAAGIAVFVTLNARWLGSEAARVTIEDARSACAGRRSAPAPQPVRDARQRPPARHV